MGWWKPLAPGHIPFGPSLHPSLLMRCLRSMVTEVPLRSANKQCTPSKPTYKAKAWRMVVKGMIRGFCLRLWVWEWKDFTPKTWLNLNGNYDDKQLIHGDVMGIVPVHAEDIWSSWGSISWEKNRLIWNLTGRSSQRKKYADSPDVFGHVTRRKGIST